MRSYIKRFLPTDSADEPQSQGPWYAGEVVELLPDGKVKVLKRGPFRQEYVLTLRNLKLAPDGLDQPKKSAKVAAEGTRTWTSVSDGSKIEAVYLGFTDGKVKMKRADGKEFTVPLERFSKADQDYVKQQSGSNDDPFAPCERTGSRKDTKSQRVQNEDPIEPVGWVQTIASLMIDPLHIGSIRRKKTCVLCPRASFGNNCKLDYCVVSCFRSVDPIEYD